MTIQFNTDKHVSGKNNLETRVRTIISSQLNRFKEQITNIHVHLSGEKRSEIGQNGNRCMLEARLENKQPITVTSYDKIIEQSINDSLDKLKTSIETVLSY